MKKLSILLGVLLVLGMTVPAMAEVWVTGTVDKTKTITVDETVTITKDVDIDVAIDNILDKVAEADAVINQDNLFNWACENCAEKIVTMNGSMMNNVGVINANQAVGNMNNQGNVVSVAVDVYPPQVPPEDPEVPDLPESAGGLAHAQTSATQKMQGNEIYTHDVLYRNAVISGSIIGNKGIVGVNQSAGNINNQLNAVTLAVSLGGTMAMAEADLGQYNSNVPVEGTNPDNASVYELNTNKDGLISGSINNNCGVVGVNQTVGNMANQANIANVAASIR
jgi:hypothetical protein